MKIQSQVLIVVLAAGVVLADTGGLARAQADTAKNGQPASAPPSSPAPPAPPLPPVGPGGRRVLRRPVVDLNKLAKETRPGQVVPDAPSPDRPNASADAPPERPVVTLQPAPPPVSAPLPASSPPAREAPADDRSPARPERQSQPPAPLPPTVPDRMMEPDRTDSPSTVPTGTPVHVSVRSVSGAVGLAEWRTEGGDWQRVLLDDELDGVIEVRTGLGAAVTLLVDRATVIRLDRLTRARIERRGGGDRGPGPATGEVTVVLDRGRVEFDAAERDRVGLAKTPVRIVTPVSELVRRVGASVEYDQYKGVRERILRQP